MSPRNTPNCAHTLLALALGGLALFTPGCAVVDAPFTVIDTVLDTPFKVAQSAVDVPFKPITDPMNSARRRSANQKYTERHEKDLNEARAKLIAEGKIPAPQIGPDGKPIYTSENYLVPVSQFSSGTLTSARTGYKSGAKVSADSTPVARPLPPSMGMAVPIPRNSAERKAWKKNGAPAIVQYPAAVHPSMINVPTVGETTNGNADAPVDGPVTYQPSISAPTHKQVYTGPGQEPRTDLGATR